MALARLVLAAAVLVGVPLNAQTCEPPADSHEATIFAVRSLGLAFGRGTTIAREPAGGVRLGAELALLPHIDAATATPTSCRPGKGPENVNALPALARPRLSVTLPGNLVLEASWLPPVRLRGMKGNLAGVSLAHAHMLTPGLAVIARVHAVRGTVTGPFTCPEDEVANEESECFGGAVSEDRFRPNITGVDVSADWQRASGLTLSAGAGYSRLAPRFRVHFRNAAGVLDSTLVRTDLNRLVLFAAASRPFATRWRAGAELYATPDDGATVRAVLDVSVRQGRDR
jgi:hypothetical protein